MPAGAASLEELEGMLEDACRSMTDRSYPTCSTSTPSCCPEKTSQVRGRAAIANVIMSQLRHGGSYVAAPQLVMQSGPLALIISGAATSVARRNLDGWRVSAGKQLLLADLRQANADAAAEILSHAGFEVSTATVDVSSRESVHALVETATALGDVTRSHPRRRRLPQPGITGNNPLGRSVRQSVSARGVRRCHRPRCCRRGDRVAAGQGATGRETP
jgi:hypothetical protein